MVLAGVGVLDGDDAAGVVLEGHQGLLGALLDVVHHLGKHPVGAPALAAGHPHLRALLCEL